MSKEEAKAAKAAEAKGGVVINRPELHPKRELPLVITPEGGTWKNEKQARYAQFLNAYYYQNPDKFEQKWEDITPVGGKVIKGLKSRLEEIGENPAAFDLYNAGTDMPTGARINDTNLNGSAA